MPEMPPLRGLFETMWDIHLNWMEELRALCADAEARGARVTRLTDVTALDGFASTI